MLSRVRSMGLNGIRGYEVSVECYITNGLPGFEIVGLPDAAVKEARERVRAAVKNCGFRFPVSRITLNMARKNPARSMICRSCSGSSRRVNSSVCRRRSARSSVS